MEENANNETIPQWLEDIQNRSWEPEILISGITLTFLFLIPEHVYNFYGMLIQEYGANSNFVRLSFTLTIAVLSGVKLALIIHLILRGLWTGMVGLAYVFPDGIDIIKAGVDGKLKDVEFQKPIDWVLSLERKCSMVFSLIFTMIKYILGLGMIYLPVALLSMLPIKPESVFTLQLSVLTVVIVGFSVFMNLKNKYSLKLLENFVNTSLNIFASRVGIQFYLFFMLFFFVSLFSSVDFIREFRFNHQKIYNKNVPSIETLNIRYYENLRNRFLRLPRASIDDVAINSDYLCLKVAYYKEDMRLLDQPETIEVMNLEKKKEDLSITDLFKVKLDGKEISGIKWYRVKEPENRQTLFQAYLPVSGIASGSHALTIDKVLYSKTKKSKWRRTVKHIHLEKDWAKIPFEKL